MIIMKIIAGIVGYIIISVIITILFAYTERKAGATAQEVYEGDKFNEYCMVGFLFPIVLPCLVFAGICKLITIVEEKIVKIIKKMCITIVELKIATEEKDEEEDKTKVEPIIEADKERRIKKWTILKRQKK